MKYLLSFLFMPLIMLGQNMASKSAVTFEKDSLIIVAKNKNKGFVNDYILYIPKGTKKNTHLYLLVEPNNSGIISDSIAVHEQLAINLATVSSVGNNIATELKIPLLVPIFPRPASKPLVYTHALDRDVMLEKDMILARPDLQLIQMIQDANTKLKACNIIVDEKIFMNGFSASGTFTNRFTMLHPERIKAAAMGGINGELMLPFEDYKNVDFDFPLGIHDLKKFTHRNFNLTAYQAIPQFFYMGALDDNDAVQYDDAYTVEESNTINTLLGKTVQERWKNCQTIYNGIQKNITFRTYENVGHWTTSAVNLDVILFFNKYLKE